FQELREENAELREERDDMERQAQAAFKVFQREAAKLREVLSRWKRDLAYLDSIKLTEAGDSSRYQLNKCIEDLEKQLAHQQPSAPTPEHKLDAEGECEVCGETDISKPCVPVQMRTVSAPTPETSISKIVDECLKTPAALDEMKKLTTPDVEEIVAQAVKEWNE